MSVDLIIESDGDAVARQAAKLFAEIVAETDGPVTVALSGGSTPRRFHRVLVEDFKETVDWSRLHVFWSDERAVAKGDPSSNVTMADETLLRQVPIPAAQVYRPDSDAEDLAGAARAYEARLTEVSGDPPQVDVVFLGMGDDGHTASLFPGEPEPSGWVAAVKAPAHTPARDRLTFTFSALAQAKRVILLVVGEKKAARLAEVYGSDGHLPLQRVLKERTERTILIADRAAAGRLAESS